MDDFFSKSPIESFKGLFKSDSDSITESSETVDEEKPQAIKKDETAKKPQKTKRKGRGKYVLIFIVVAVIIIVAAVDNSSLSTINQSSENDSIRMAEIATAKTQSIQNALDIALGNSSRKYIVEVEIGAISGDDLGGWLNIYPQNAASWDLLPLSYKKNLVAVLVDISSNEINGIGQVYVRNNVRILAEGSRSIFGGETKIEIK